MNKSIYTIIPRPRNYNMVGDGFRVYNYFPAAFPDRQAISPFLMLDFNPSFDFGPSDQPRGVDVHPHKGFETVTIAYKGAVAHHDSSGNHGVIHPGEVQRMTAGAGILHNEYHEAEFAANGGPFEMVQLWVNLPAKHKLTAPKYQSISGATMPVVPVGDEGKIRVIAGNCNGVTGSASTFTPVNLFDIRLKNKQTTEFAIPAVHNALAVIIHGSVKINQQEIPEHGMVVFNHDGDRVQMEALSEAVILFMSGEPIHEPVAQYGPFVMNTQEELMVAFEEFRSGKFGVL